MKKITSFSLIILVFFNFQIYAQDAGTRYIENKTITGKLEYDFYSEFPYSVLSNQKSIGLKVVVDNKNKNNHLHFLIGKQVIVKGQMFCVTVKTEYHGLEFIDLRGGKGSILEKN
jgi:hypothetical protein